MKRALFIFVAAFCSVASAAECPKRMPSAVEGRMLPVLDAFAEAMKKNDYWDKRYEAAVDRLLRGQGTAAREARVALMDYYIGEAYGEELVCAVAKDGSSKLLRLYSTCDIQPSRSPVPRDRTLPLRKYALEIIASGKGKDRCTYH